jgi:hypothetical protein
VAEGSRPDQGADPDLGGEETLDLELAAGVHSVALTARVPPDDEECGGLLAPAPGHQARPAATGASLCSEPRSA